MLKEPTWLNRIKNVQVRERGKVRMKVVLMDIPPDKAQQCLYWYVYDPKMPTLKLKKTCHLYFGQSGLLLLSSLM
jgi:hypothetical protein